MKYDIGYFILTVARVCMHTFGSSVRSCETNIYCQYNLGKAQLYIIVLDWGLMLYRGPSGEMQLVACSFVSREGNITALTQSVSSADGDVVAVRPQDLGHHGSPGGVEGEAAAHRAAPGREGPGTGRGRQGNQPHLRGGERVGRAQSPAPAGVSQAVHIITPSLTVFYNKLSMRNRDGGLKPNCKCHHRHNFF